MDLADAGAISHSHKMLDWQRELSASHPYAYVLNEEELDCVMDDDGGDLDQAVRLWLGERAFGCAYIARINAVGFPREKMAKAFVEEWL